MLRKMQVDVHQVQYGASFTKSARAEGAEAWRGHFEDRPAAGNLHILHIISAQHHPNSLFRSDIAATWAPLLVSILANKAPTSAQLGSNFGPLCPKLDPFGSNFGPS
jgi:hypothetical protein